MNNRREHKKPSKKQKLSELKSKEDKEILNSFKNQNFNQEKSSREISVIHPVSDSLEKTNKLS
jgi:hypothetical protein